MEAIQQITAVAVVLLLLGATLWVLRRRGFAGVALGNKSAGRRIQCLERLPLGPQHTLHLVRVDETELLLALSPSGCRLVESLARRTAEAGRRDCCVSWAVLPSHFPPWGRRANRFLSSESRPGRTALRSACRCK